MAVRRFIDSTKLLGVARRLDMWRSRISSRNLLASMVSGAERTSLFIPLIASMSMSLFLSEAMWYAIARDWVAKLRTMSRSPP